MKKKNAPQSLQPAREPGKAPALAIPVQRALLPIQSLLPPLYNPRTDFDPQKQAELEASLMEHGFAEALSLMLVRPIEYRKVDPEIVNGWNIELRFPGGEWLPMLNTLPAPFRAALGLPQFFVTAEEADDAIALLPTHEIVDGERRYRGCNAVGIPTVPVNIAELTDDQAVEYQLVSVIQRAELSPLEEAAGVCRMLAMRNGPGADAGPLYTAETLAVKLGKMTPSGKPDLMFITRSKQLHSLSGTPAGEAIVKGDLTPTHGCIIGRLPTAKLREEVTKVALKGRYGDGMMTKRQLEDYVKEKCTVQLKGAQFDQGDAELVPVEIVDGVRCAGGACQDCPFNSANLPTELGEKPGKFQMCLNTDCHSRKQRAAYEVWAAKQTGPAEVVGFDERVKLLNPYSGELNYHSTLIELNERPPEHLLKPSVKNPPPWKKLIADKGVPEKVLKNFAGAVLHVAEQALCIAAAMENGHRIFQDDEHEVQNAKQQVATEKRREAFVTELRKDPANATMTVEDALKEFERQEKERQKAAREEQQRKEQREREIAGRLEGAGRKAFFAALKGAKKITREFWELLLHPLMEFVDEGDGLGELAEVLGCPIEEGNHGAAKKAVATALDASPLEHLPALAIMIAHAGLYYDTRADWEKKAFKLYGVDLKAAHKTERDAIATEEKAAALAREIAEGMKWVTRREKVDDFEWSDGFAVNPDLCDVAMPCDVKAEVALFAARGKKGWRAGVKITSKKHGDFELLMQDSATDYGTRELAIIPQLKSAQNHFLKVKVPAAVERIEDYIARLQTPTEKAAPAKGGKKKKGGK